MVQETIRFSEGMTEKVDELLDQGVFETKSEFYRFAAETLLVSLNDDYQPDMVDYERHQQSVRNAVEDDDGEFDTVCGDVAKNGEGDNEDECLFYTSAITIRRLAREGDIDSAKEYIDDNYTKERGELLLLEALLDYYTD